MLADRPDSTLADFADSWDVDFLHSKPVLDTHRLDKPPEHVFLADFFTNRQTAITSLPDGNIDFTTNHSESELKRPTWAINNARLVIDKSGLVVPPRLPLKTIKL